MEILLLIWSIIQPLLTILGAFSLFTVIAVVTAIKGYKNEEKEESKPAVAQARFIDPRLLALGKTLERFPEFRVTVEYTSSTEERLGEFCKALFKESEEE
jgi:hypothetical protein